MSSYRTALLGNRDMDIKKTVAVLHLYSLSHKVIYLTPFSALVQFWKVFSNSDKLLIGLSKVYQRSQVP